VRKFAKFSMIGLLVLSVELHAQTQVSDPQPIATVTASSESGANCPALSFSGLTPDSGTLMVAVYASADTFLKKPVWATAKKVSTATMQLPVCGVEASEIAVVVFQDMNDNQKLDTNPIGIPTEPYSASGTPSMFGRPTWNDTKVAFGKSAGLIAIKF
jgi:uncharacterized protein (DUF2141 family)